jgi:hypothetical protein
MSGQAKAQQIEVVPKAELVKRLARYLEQQPESVRTADKLMRGLEAASLVLPIAGLITAIVLVVTGSASLNQSIPAAIFAVMGCFTPWMFLLGLHSVLIRAFPPVRYLMADQTEKSLGFFTGSTAVGMGVVIMVAALFSAAFCAMGAYAFFDPNILDILIPLIIVFSVGAGILGTYVRKRARQQR